MSTRVSVLCFVAGGSRFAIAASEVARIGEPTPTCEDLGVLLGLPRALPDQRTYSVELDRGGRSFTVSGPLNFSSMERADLVAVSRELWHRDMPIVGYARKDGEVVALLDAAVLCRAQRPQAQDPSTTESQTRETKSE